MSSLSGSESVLCPKLSTRQTEVLHSDATSSSSFFVSPTEGETTLDFSLFCGQCQNQALNRHMHDCSFGNATSYSWDHVWKGPGEAQHSLLAVSFVYNSAVYVWGGYNRKGETNEIPSFDPISETLPEVEHSTTKPPPRQGAAWALNGSKLFIFGGMAQDQHRNDIFVCHLSAQPVHRTDVAISDTEAQPSVRFCMQAFLQWDSLFLLGGELTGQSLSDGTLNTSIPILPCYRVDKSLFSGVWWQSMCLSDTRQDAKCTSPQLIWELSRWKQFIEWWTVALWDSQG